MKFLNRKITKDQSRDTGMAMVLLLLIIYLSLKRRDLVVAAIALQIVAMTVPRLFAPVAIVWLGMSDLLGAISSRVLLSLGFFAVVTPIALLRRLAGKDSLQLRAFKANHDSVMLNRNHVFTSSDMDKPY